MVRVLGKKTSRARENVMQRLGKIQNPLVDKILHFQTCFHDKLQFIPQCLRESKKMRRQTIPSTRLKNPVFSNNCLHFQVSSISETNSNDCTFRTTSTKGLPQILVTVISNMY